MTFYDRDCLEVALNIDFANTRRLHKIYVEAKKVLSCCLK